MWRMETGRLGWDPWAEMRRMQNEMNRLFADFETTAQPSDFPAVNLWVGGDSVVVTAEIPGVSEKEIELTAHEDTLTIRARRDQAAGLENVTWHRRERVHGAFARTVQLPFAIDPDKVKARYVNGTLEIELGRPEADKPKRIQIRAN